MNELHDGRFGDIVRIRHLASGGRRTNMKDTEEKKRLDEAS